MCSCWSSGGVLGRSPLKSSCRTPHALAAPRTLFCPMLVLNNQAQAFRHMESLTGSVNPGSYTVSNIGPWFLPCFLANPLSAGPWTEGSVFLDPGLWGCLLAFELVLESILEAQPTLSLSWVFGSFHLLRDAWWGAGDIGYTLQRKPPKHTHWRLLLGGRRCFPLKMATEAGLCHFKYNVLLQLVWSIPCPWDYRRGLWYWK